MLGLGRKRLHSSGCCLVVAVLLVACAETPTEPPLTVIRGRVLDGGAAVSDALVELHGSGIWDQTTGAGGWFEYSSPNIPARDYYIMIRKTGYDEKREPLVGTFAAGPGSVVNRGEIFVSQSAPPPPAPTLSRPPNGTKTKTPLFEWSSPHNAHSYELIVDDDSSFSSPVIGRADLSDSHYTPAVGLSDGKYYWKVRARNNAGWGGWSATRSFTVDTGGLVPRASSKHQANHDSVVANGLGIPPTPLRSTDARWDQ